MRDSDAVDKNEAWYRIVHVDGWQNTMTHRPFRAGWNYRAGIQSEIDGRPDTATTSA